LVFIILWGEELAPFLENFQAEVVLLGLPREEKAGLAILLDNDLGCCVIDPCES
jgi:hypothetical protein